MVYFGNTPEQSNKQKLWEYNNDMILPELRDESFKISCFVPSVVQRSLYLLYVRVVLVEADWSQEHASVGVNSDE